MEAQRYPQDFDGIVAGAPAFDWTGFAATMVSIAKALYPNPAHLDSTVLTREALGNLQQAILEQCDAQDGLKDGIIADPPSVRFDLSKVPGLTDATAQGHRGNLPGSAQRQRADLSRIPRRGGM